MASACDGTCIGLAAGLGAAFFLAGLGLIYYFREQIYAMRNKHSNRPAAKDEEEAEDNDDLPDVEEGYVSPPASPIPQAQEERTSSVFQEIDLEAGPTPTISAKQNSAYPQQEDEETTLFPESPDTKQSRYQAELLQQQLEEMENEQHELEQKSKRLQEEIKFLSKMNNVMALDTT